MEQHQIKTLGSMENWMLIFYSYSFQNGQYLKIFWFKKETCK